MPNLPVLTVIVRTKDKVFYQGPAYAVTALNDKGPFDILQKHENFISLIKETLTIRTTPREKLEFQIHSGIVRVYKDKAYIYVNLKA